MSIDEDGIWHYPGSAFFLLMLLEAMALIIPEDGGRHVKSLDIKIEVKLHCAVIIK
jgi:hypothetical protein